MSRPTFTAGIDIGDRCSYLCLLDHETGEVTEESRISISPAAMERRFCGAEPMRVAIEAGTHSPWVRRSLESCGHEILVANARKLRLIYSEGRKSELHAENLARLARLDPTLLAPLKHRGEASQAHPALLRSRQALVGARTKLVNHVRGSVKSFGGRLPERSAGAFPKKVATHIPEPLRPALEPLLETITALAACIRECGRRIEALAEEVYPETRLLRQVGGVGPITALAFVLVIENPDRFETSRTVGTYAGLVPAPNGALRRGREPSGLTAPP